MQHLRILFGSLLALALCLLPAGAAVAQERDALVMVGHANVPRIDQATVQKLYTGRTIEVGGVTVSVFNAAPGSKARERFMATVMAMDDDKYVAYWTVRKHVGKGAPPREFKSAAELIDHLQANPGSVGYVLGSELRPGLNVIFRP
jgi:hypothetical protein